MLNLLSPDQINDEKKKAANEMQRRVWGLAEEESRLVRNVNSLRHEEDQLERRIDNFTATDEATYDTRKGILRREVEELESRRAKAMLPVSEVLAEAKKYLDENKAESERIDRRKEKIAEREKTLVLSENRLAERIEEFEDASADKKSELDRREVGIAASDAEIRQQTESLSSGWIEYHTAVAAANESMSSRERDVRHGEKANQIIRAELEKRSLAQDERERGITDKYNSLLAATQEFEKKQHGQRKTR